ncbi:MAG: ligand-binding sensor domain-containing protein [Myxococcota bacterium]|jgi:ligand-binding sensor domain-containing protein
MMLGLIVTVVMSQASPSVVSTRDVRSCVVLDDGSILAASSGGVFRSSAAGVPGDVELAGQSSYVVRELDGELGPEVYAGTEHGLWRVSIEKDQLSVKLVVASFAVRDVLKWNGTLYVATWGGGLRTLDGGTATAVPFATVGSSAARMRQTSLVIHDGRLVVGTAGGGVFELVAGLLHPLGGASAVDTMVWSLLSTPSGLVAGTLAGQYLFAAGQWTQRSSDDVRALASGPAHGELAGTFGRGLLAKDMAEGTMKYVAAVDVRNDTVCVGGPQGLAVHRDGRGWRHVAEQGPPSNDISSMVHDGEKLWVGTFDSGLAVFDGRWRSVVGVDERINGLAIEKTARGPVTWAATARGLVRVEMGRVRRFGRADGLQSTDVHTVTALRGGGVAAGTSAGLILVKNGTVQLQNGKHGLYVRGVWSIAEGQGKTLWVGTMRGVFHGSRANRRTGRRRWTRLSVASGHLPDDWVTALAVDSAGAVWAGTYSGGTSRLTRNDDGKWQAEQLGGGWVNVAGLTAVGDAMYAATMDGLMRWDPAATRWRTIKRAAPGRDVTALVKAPGGLWVSSRRGISRWATLR